MTCRAYVNSDIQLLAVCQCSSCIHSKTLMTCWWPRRECVPGPPRLWRLSWKALPFLLMQAACCRAVCLCRTPLIAGCKQTSPAAVCRMASLCKCKSYIAKLLRPVGAEEAGQCLPLGIPGEHKRACPESCVSGLTLGNKARPLSSQVRHSLCVMKRVAASESHSFTVTDLQQLWHPEQTSGNPELTIWKDLEAPQILNRQETEP